MTIISEERLSDSPFVETIEHGWTMSAGTTIRPAEIHWHIVLVKHDGLVNAIVVGPLTNSGIASWGKGGEIIWIKFKLGTFMPHLPTRRILDNETILPEGAFNSFWLNGSVWEFPNFENVNTFVDRLVRDDILVHDPVVNAALQDQVSDMSSRTLRHRFLQATGLTQGHIRQMRRAQQAESLLQQGASILDVVDEAGYFDQPHLTRSLKQFIGYTPAQIIRMSNCHSVQDTALDLHYDSRVLVR